MIFPQILFQSLQSATTNFQSFLFSVRLYQSLCVCESDRYITVVTVMTVQQQRHDLS